MPTMRSIRYKWALAKAPQYRAVADAANELARQLEHYADYDNEALLAFLDALGSAMPETFNIQACEELYAETRDEIQEEATAEGHEATREQLALASWLRGQQ